MTNETTSFMTAGHGRNVLATTRGTCATLLVTSLLVACSSSNEGLPKNGIDGSLDQAFDSKHVNGEVANVAPDAPTTCMANGVVYGVNQTFVVAQDPCPLTCLCQSTGPSCMTVCPPDGGTLDVPPGIDGAPAVTCSRGGKTYPPGQTVELGDGCGGWCVCKLDGTFQCTPACADAGADAATDSPLIRPEAGPESAPTDVKLDGSADRSPDRQRDLGPDTTKLDATACTAASNCPDPTSGHGAGVCEGGVCGITCDSGYHRCGDTCASNTSIQSCGTGANACTACPTPPANGSATCSGTPLACGVACNTGYHRCGNACVANNSTDVASCGNSCTVCHAPGNGSVTCNGSACVLACNTGYHLCGTTCVANNSTDTCGTSCGACPDPAHGSPTCTGSPLTCGVTCDSGYHLCGNTCVANNSTSGCGSACTACPTDPNGQASCDGTQCRLACNTGYHLCNGQCVSNTSPATCGSSCSPCPTAAGATATCRGTPPTCGLDWNCSDGYIECGGACVLESASQCGDTCATCPAPGAGIQHAKAVCNGGTCDIACVDGYHDCGTTTVDCVSNNEKANCGSSCTPCPDPPPNGSASCNGTRCTVVCDTNYHLCDGACLSNHDLNSCGPTSCSPCPYPPESQQDTTYAVCDGTKCGFACRDGNHLCGTPGTCQPNDDQHCGDGAACKACDPGQTCSDGTCHSTDASVP